MLLLSWDVGKTQAPVVVSGQDRSVESLCPGFAFLEALAAAEAVSYSQNKVLILVATLKAAAIQLICCPLRIIVDI